MWSPSKSDLKTYRHFDHAIPIKKILPLVSDAAYVAAHKFMPLLHFEKKWRRAPKKEAGKLVRRKPKSREIRYPCRKDSYIFKYYRELLSERYEDALVSNGIADCIIAYRHIPKHPGTESCKSNIEFARDAIEAVKEIGDCCAVAIDISDFFGSMDHSRIKLTWQSLLGVERLPDDHFTVFSALTKYRYVDRDAAYVALGYSALGSDGKIRYRVKPDQIPIQICSNKQFREKIVSQGLVQKHTKDHGIPQGCPLSDLIANAYLMEFDIGLAKYARSKGGDTFDTQMTYYLFYPETVERHWQPSSRRPKTSQRWVRIW